MSPLLFRFAAYYAALFLVVGVQMPYWPLWLQGRGLSAAEIGILVATQLWVKVAFNPIIGHIVDRTGKRRPILFILAAGSVVSTALFPAMHSFAGLVILSMAAGALFAAMLPVGDTLTMTHVIRKGHDYGRIRLWGSLSFIGASTLCGRLLDVIPSSMIVWLIVGTMAPLCLIVFILPEEPLPPPTATSTRLRWIDLLSSPSYWTFLAATALIGSAHAVYYGFATLHWQKAGLSHAWIGSLWGIGVAAEVVLFAFSGAVVRRLGPFRLLILGGTAGMLRWTLMGLTVDPLFLVPLQCLHACTFGATHLGAMHFIGRHIAPGIAGRAQGLYAAMGNGVALGLATVAAGPMYAAWGGGAFVTMGVLSLLGVLAAIRLRRLADRSGKASTP